MKVVSVGINRGGVSLVFWDEIDSYIFVPSLVCSCRKDPYKSESPYIVLLLIYNSIRYFGSVSEL